MSPKSLIKDAPIDLISQEIPRIGSTLTFGKTQIYVKNIF